MCTLRNLSLYYVDGELYPHWDLSLHYLDGWVYAQRDLSLHHCIEIIV